MAINLNTIKVQTSPFNDQKPGTSGLRKPTKHFFQPNYVENFVQSILNSEGENINGATLVVGGDGRWGVREAIKRIISISAASGVRKLLIGQHGILSTPAVSCIIRKRRALGGILLTASHNPGGQDADFGIKYNGTNGGPAPDQVTNNIFDISKTLTEYNAVDEDGAKLLGKEVNLDFISSHYFKVNNDKDFTVEIIDSVADYVELMKQIYDFQQLRDFLKTFPILINAMNAVSGPYARRIFIDELKCPSYSVVKSKPLEDFGGIHPDPNLIYAAELVDALKSNGLIEFGAAYDGDADRNMVIGANGFFVNPSDSLAVLLDHLHLFKWYKSVPGVARSMPTSMAVDRVATALGIPCYEVPTGWKYFGNLMDSDKIALCGEESFGTGSVHIREKDGIWTTLLWLSVLAHRNSTVASIMAEHWDKYGRNYYGRHDYENVDSSKANELMSSIEAKFHDRAGLEKLIGCEVETADNFSYTDPVDGSVTEKQGLRLIFKNGSRIVWRLSGTGSSGATVRVYLEKYDKENLDLEVEDALKDMVQISDKVSQIKGILGVDGPTVIT